MPAIPLKPQYGPTLGRLLAPRWHAARPSARAAVAVAGLVLLLALVAAVLSLLDAGYSHGPPVPFSFRYRSLHRARPLPGGYVRVLRGSRGRLRDSFEVAPLRVGAYRGSVTGELPLLAAGYIRELRRRFPDFVLRGEGKTRITSTLAGYDVRYSALVDGVPMHGRDVMLLPPGAHVREGVVLEMLTSEAVSVAKPVASQGALERPLKSFSFG